jgi:hypothetical protein
MALLPLRGKAAHTPELQCTLHIPLMRALLLQVSAVTPPPDDWTQMVVGFGVPEPMAKDLANM